MTTDYIDPQPLGRCIGVAGTACGRVIFDDDPDAVELERGAGVIGGCCYKKLFDTVSWGNQLGEIGRPGQRLGGQIAKARGSIITLPGSGPVRQKRGGPSGLVGSKYVRGTA